MLALESRKPLWDNGSMRRLLGKFTVGDDCWEWTGARNPAGYGVVHRAYGERVAHRAVYRWLVGDIPEGMTLDHLCGNKSCVRPDHLEPVTHWENNRRGNSISGRRARATHCEQGHPFDEENTGYDRGWRVCLTCRAVNYAATRERRNERERMRRIGPSGDRRRAYIREWKRRRKEAEHADS